MHPKLSIIITGDGLYSKQPFIDAVKENGMSYILVAKPNDHKILFEWVADISAFGEDEHFEFKDQKGRRHKYRWINDVPLNGFPNADQVNFFQYWIIDKIRSLNCAIFPISGAVQSFHPARNTGINCDALSESYRSGIFITC